MTLAFLSSPDYQAAYYTVLSEFQHLSLTMGIAFLLFVHFRDWRLLPVCFFFGFLIDLDHWLDYFFYFGLKISLSNFFKVASYTAASGKVYLFLHGWEWVIIFWFLGRYLGSNWRIKGLKWAICLPYLGHLLVDHFSFYHHPLAYSFVFRLLTGFSTTSFDGIYAS
ncbi:MAG: hypothetical protein JW991_05720 [Candidatus Pacebacteria bacterium]|nr:hypothetical protein [Candidatus Paceibacterota bacterium]